MRQRVYVIAGVKAWAQLLCDRIEHTPEFSVVGSAPDATLALADLERLDAAAGIVVIDVGTPLALQTAALLRSSATRLVAVGLNEDPGGAIAWASTGAVGLVGRTAPIEELLDILTQVGRGEASCSAAISGSLLRGINSVNGEARHSHNTMPLTRRELEVASLVADGLSNKEIATRLHISPGTTKSHVHNVIRKLGVTRRAQVANKLPHDSSVSLVTLPPAIVVHHSNDSARAKLIRASTRQSQASNTRPAYR